MLPKTCTTNTTTRPRRLQKIEPPSTLAVVLFLTLPTLGWVLARLIMNLRDLS